MSSIESTPSTNGSDGFGQIEAAPPELREEIAKIGEEEYVLQGVEELDRRTSHDIDVALFYRKGSDDAVVEVIDRMSGECHDVTVDKEHAQDAYHHPYPYIYNERPPTIHSVKDPEPTRWDKALDRLNQLPPEKRKEAIEWISGIRGANPTMVYEAIKMQLQARRIDKAA